MSQIKPSSIFAMDDESKSGSTKKIGRISKVLDAPQTAQCKCGVRQRRLTCGTQTLLWRRGTGVSSSRPHPMIWWFVPASPPSAASHGCTRHMSESCSSLRSGLCSLLRNRFDLFNQSVRVYQFHIPAKTHLFVPDRFDLNTQKQMSHLSRTPECSLNRKTKNVK